MTNEHLYEVDLQWTDTRKGILSSQALDQTVTVATPPEFAKGIAGVWSPEHLFVSAISACLMTTFLAIAENSKLNFVSFACKAVGTLGTVEGKYQMTKVQLQPTVVVQTPEDVEKAQKILLKSEKACLISNSVKSEVTMQANIVVATVVA